MSTADQTTDNPVREIEAAGFKIERRRAVTETVSGSIAAIERKGFSRLVDRLGRNAIDVRATVKALAAAGVRVYYLALDGVDLSSAAGKMTMAC